MMYLMLQEIRFQVQVLKPCKSVQEPSQKMLSIYRDLELSESCGSTADRQIVIICLGFLFSQP